MDEGLLFLAVLLLIAGWMIWRARADTLAVPRIRHFAAKPPPPGPAPGWTLPRLPSRVVMWFARLPITLLGLLVVASPADSLFRMSVVPFILLAWATLRTVRLHGPASTMSKELPNSLAVFFVTFAIRSFFSFSQLLLYEQMVVAPALLAVGFALLWLYAVQPWRPSVLLAPDQTAAAVSSGEYGVGIEQGTHALHDQGGNFGGGGASGSWGEDMSTSSDGDGGGD